MRDNAPADARWVERGTLTFLVGLLLMLFLFNTVAVPIYDAWELVPLLQAREAGTLQVADIWAQHNEHRPVVPRLVMLAMAAATGWDVRWELAMNLLLGSALALVLGQLVAGAVLASSLIAFLLLPGLLWYLLGSVAASG